MTGRIPKSENSSANNTSVTRRLDDESVPNTFIDPVCRVAPSDPFYGPEIKQKG
jgi:hypothetical protein